MAVIAAAVAATAVKLYLAATTSGTNDIVYWTQFAAGVREFGPIGIYGEAFEAPYNHPPLAGWFLELVNLGQRAGLGLPLLIRAPACLADAMTCWLVFRLLNERSSTLGAGAAAVGLVWSPALLVISGFHGNTDPVFVALTVASFFLLARRGRSLASGVCLGLAVSIKLVPVVAVPWMMLLAYRRGAAALVRFAIGGALVFALLWVPVLVLNGGPFLESVVGYRGIWLREWGLAELVEQAGYPRLDVWLNAHGSWVVAAAAMVPLALTPLRRPHEEAVGLGMTLVTMLVFTPAFGMQYLTWALAAAYLVSIRTGWTYNVAASLLVLSVYSLWSGGGPPWRWEQAWAVPFTLGQHMLMAVAWACLLLNWLDGIYPATNQSRRAQGDHCDEHQRNASGHRHRGLQRREHAGQNARPDT
ncbi:hypothetical protein ASG76_09590 [Nocardioides sp. Soil774]|uniref:glycosyltransferase 87 family protein n=1 Tax=Nocardioides sp. Soil774 TaxID=1736408 RepID=UPI0006F73FD1|nr:glycosyltransferase 87 family protein [Nocardioides sp. Soil774]KRE94656.1 hypothetical protein ASG76_09590 [Nocardioides sp. Soil774]